MTNYTKTNVSSITGVNSELQKIELAIADQLDRTGGSPNNMSADLDMNSNHIINVPEATDAAQAMSYGQFLNSVVSSNFDAAEAKFIDTMALAILDTSLVIGNVIILKDRANGIFDVISGTGTANTFNIVAHSTLPISLSLRVDSVANVLQFGATNARVDTTDAVRAAAEYLDAGGGVLYFPNGTYALSTTDVLPWCVTLSANTTVQGESRGGAIITRPASTEVAEISLLFANKGANTATGYLADGNITIQNLTMTDSPTNTERTAINGDLIAFGHGDGLVVQNCNFGNHSQHCLDIGGSKNILFTGNFQNNTNGLTGAAENSAVQVDSANGAAFLGLNVDGTESENVVINDNSFININSNSLIHVGHNSGTAKNITITNNYLKGSTRSFARLIKCDTTEASIDGLIIENNTIDCTTLNNTAISIATEGNDSEQLKNISIQGNIIKGVARVGIEFGVNDNYLGATYLSDIKNVTIANNIVDLDFTGSTLDCAGILTTICQAVTVEGNTVNTTVDTDTQHGYGIRVITGNQIVIKDNIVNSNIDTYIGTKDTALINVAKYGSVASSVLTDVSISGNSCDVSSTKYGIITQSSVFETDYTFISENRFVGTLTNGDAHIFEELPSSDGTNGFRAVDITGASGYVVAISTTDTIAVNTGLIKKSGNGFVASPNKIEITYTSTGIGNLSTVQEVIRDNASTIGIQTKLINPSLGTFTIQMGSAGVSSTLTAAGASSTRTSGSITVMAGI